MTTLTGTITIAFPILKEFCPATIFVVTGFIGSDYLTLAGSLCGFRAKGRIKGDAWWWGLIPSHTDWSQEQVLKREFAANIGIIQEKLGYGLVPIPGDNP